MRWALGGDGELLPPMLERLNQVRDLCRERELELRWVFQGSPRVVSNSQQRNYYFMYLLIPCVCFITRFHHHRLVIPKVDIYTKGFMRHA